ncbi:hypothetical protein ES708_30838 [subsurface metagenome]
MYARPVMKKILKKIIKVTHSATFKLVWKLIKILFLNNKGVSNNVEKKDSDPKIRNDY